ncbi:hypothetical protein DOH76_23565 [Salmonella enterica subsp. enterica serovar Oranienburg]|uniref:inosine/xanthosine triphosphatase n=1 Tax=Salmonella diarizonae TaxID=59204 RepID=A0A5Y1YDF6_SALDZ|nr:hypothetical protein [Salmonella enterica subsp. enterica serovar Oranienburg]ECC3916752.1 DUF84 family protein [Salmonella enterica subsp. diarizonae]EDR7001694.1 DUF84 family protein [Salmonella enterica subsp. enterica serovar Java]EEH0186440.1 DUF84 family protein [Salmonella enterica subsp. enterica serovar Oranienburg]EJC3483634.1 DUF84 family protein [Salmonella enterica]
MKMQNDNLTIWLASKNKAKKEAVELIASELFKNYSINCCESNSGVSNTPLSDEEAIQGCINRIDSINGFDTSNESIYISMEGLIKKETFGCFVYGWVTIKWSKSKKIYYGCSGKVMLPDDVYNKCLKGEHLSDVVRSLHPMNNDLWGTNGLMTQGIYTRVDEFMTALKCAIGCFIGENKKELKCFLNDNLK